MKISVLLLVACIVIWLLLSLGQIWFAWLSEEAYIRISLSLALIGGGASLIALILREYRRDQQLKKDGYLND